MFSLDAHIKKSGPYLESFQRQFTGLAPKLCAQINEKQLRKNLIHSNLGVLNLYCNCI